MVKINAQVLSGPLKGHSYHIKSDSEILIGRSDDSIIQIDYDNYCSRNHCVLYMEGDSCFIRDLNSTNGPFVNKVIIYEPLEIKDGDIISLGSTNISISFQ